MNAGADPGFSQLKFRDPARGRALAAEAARLAQEIGRAPITLMHVCGSHEQAIARFGLRASFPPEVELIMGPGCPVCVTDLPEVDEAVALARSGVRVATYGDMLRVPGTVADHVEVRRRRPGHAGADRSVRTALFSCGGPAGAR